MDEVSRLVVGTRAVDLLVLVRDTRLAEVRPVVLDGELLAVCLAVLGGDGFRLVRFAFQGFSDGIINCVVFPLEVLSCAVLAGVGWLCLEVGLAILGAVFSYVWRCYFD